MSDPLIIRNQVDRMTDAEITQLLFYEDGLQKSDVILVIGNANDEVSAQRARHAATLFHEGYAKTVLVSGKGLGEVTEAEFMKKILLEQGVPETQILVEAKSTTTKQNFAFAAKLLEESGLYRSGIKVILVSCPWHMARARHYAQVAFEDAVLTCSPHSESCTAETWADCPDCRKLIRGDWDRPEVIKGEVYYVIREGLPKSR